MKQLRQKKMHALRSAPGGQDGFSLIELMIASVIGLVILGGAVTIFTSNSASSKMTTGMTRIQDSGRVALDIISYSARMTGYDGCRDEIKESAVVIASDPPTINMPDNALWGSEVGTGNTWAPAVHPDLAAAISNRVRANTDVFYVQHGSGRSETLAADMTGPSGDIVLPGNPDQIGVNDMLMISNCELTEIFRATGVSDVGGNTVIEHSTAANDRGNFNTTYTGVGDKDTVPVRVMRFESKAYFVGDSGRTTPQGATIFSLFSLDTTVDGAEPTELVEGVENLQVLYGENIQPGADTPLIRYVTADNITNAANVFSVQLGLLIATADYAASSDDGRSYNIAGTNIGPPADASANDNHAGDRRMRAAFNTTIQLRNRTL